MPAINSAQFWAEMDCIVRCPRDLSLSAILSRHAPTNRLYGTGLLYIRGGDAALGPVDP
jgi:hypothetical protein